MSKKTNNNNRLFYSLMAIAGLLVFIPARLTQKANHSISYIVNLFSSVPYTIVAQSDDSLGEMLEASDPQFELKNNYLAAVNALNNARSELEYQQQFITELANIRSEYSLGRAMLIRSHVTAEDSSVIRRAKVIDRGSNDFIVPGLIALASASAQFSTDSGQGDLTGDPVTNAVWKTAVAGLVKEVRTSSSVIQLINDPAFTANVVIRPAFQRDVSFLTEGVLYNDGSGKIHIKHVETSSVVMPGDGVFLKASEQTLPVDIILGYVDLCNYDPDNAVLWNITVKPAVDLSDIKDVVVIRKNNELQ